MSRRPTGSTRTETHVPYPTRCRSFEAVGETRTAAAVDREAQRGLCPALALGAPADAGRRRGRQGDVGKLRGHMVKIGSGGAQEKGASAAGRRTPPPLRTLEGFLFLVADTHPPGLVARPRRDGPLSRPSKGQR